MGFNTASVAETSYNGFSFSSSMYKGGSSSTFFASELKTKQKDKTLFQELSHTRRMVEKLPNFTGLSFVIRLYLSQS